MLAYRIKCRTLRIAVSRRIDVIFGIGFIGIIAFYFFEWQHLCSLIAKVACFILEDMGVRAFNVGCFIIANGSVTEIAKECTNLLWLFGVLPFVFLLFKKWHYRCGLMLALLISWFSLNLVRIVFAIWMNLKGYRWFICHDIPYYAFYAFLIFIFLIWLKKNSRIKTRKREVQARTGLECVR